MNTLFLHLEQLAAERWMRQGVRTFLRACWLAASVWCIGLGGHLLWNWPLRFNTLAVLSLGILGAGLILMLRPRMSRREVARRLDRRFHLEEQLATAVELADQRAAGDGIPARLVAESGRTAAQVRRVIARQQAAPWSEVIALGALLMLLAGLLVLVGIGRPDQGLIGASAAPLPGLVSPEEQQLPEEPFTPPTGGPQSAGLPDESQPGSEGGNPDPQVLGPIADALRDQGATRPAAEALDQGDVAGAAESLRELADQAGQLSEEARQDLARNLREAANTIEERNPELAEQLRDSAEGLNEGGREAEQALEDLARALEQTQPPGEMAAGEQGEQGQQGQGEQAQGEQGQGEQGQGAQGEQPGGEAGNEGQGSGQGSGTGDAPAGEQRQAAPSSRLGVEGQPIELNAEGQGQDSSGQTDKQPSSAEVVPGRVSGGGSSQDIQPIGADPLRVPVDERNVVQDYFTP